MTINLAQVAAYEDRRWYAYGFALLTSESRNNKPAAIGTWDIMGLGAWSLAVHPDCEVRRLETARGTAVLIGHVFAAHGTDSVDRLMRRLLVHDDWSALDDLAGRYVLFWSTGSAIRVLNDPIGAQSVYYSLSDRAVVASHAPLAAQLAGRGHSEAMADYLATDEHRAKRTKFLPGVRTLFDDVHALLPNTYLDVAQKRTQRFWPRSEPVASSFDDLAEATDEYFDRYAAFLRDRSTAVIGLTGGVDSRAVIAALRARRLPLTLSTWLNMGAEEQSRIPAMVRHLGQPHEFVDVTSRPEAPGLKDAQTIAWVNGGMWRPRPLLPFQMERSHPGGGVFVRGYGGEILRGTYHSSGYHAVKDDLSFVVRLYMTRAVQKPGRFYREYTQEAFDEYLSLGHYSALPAGHDIGVLHYWEHRMGVWAPCMHNELDVAFFGHTAMNSRRLFDISAGLPLETRLGKQLLERLMGREDPELLAL